MLRPGTVYGMLAAQSRKGFRRFGITTAATVLALAIGTHLRLAELTRCLNMLGPLEISAA